MQALGLIETRGLVVAIESADAMLKAADVTLLERTLVGGGLVSIAVTGEVAAVKAAVDAGAAAVRQINAGLLVSQHVIPRPHEELDDVMVSVTPLQNRDAVTEDIEVIVESVSIEEAESTPTEETESTPVKEAEAASEILLTSAKESMDLLVAEKGLNKAVEYLNKLKVIELRTLARDYKDFGIAGRLISKADKKMLIAEFKKYYGKK